MMIKNMRMIEFDPKNPMPNQVRDFTNLFEMWYSVWRQSYEFFGWDPNSVFSDQWLRQDSIMGLFEGDRPVGSVFFDFKNFTLPMVFSDSYFRMWPKEIMQNIAKWHVSQNVVVTSFFTLSPEYRKRTKDPIYKYLLTSITVRLYLSKETEIMLGTLVHAGGMSQLCQDNGAELIKENINEKGVTCDLLSWKRSQLTNLRFPHVHDEVQYLWENNSDRIFRPKNHFEIAA